MAIRGMFCVKYDDLTHPQWSVGITFIAAEEADLVIQRHMFKYLAALQEDACDFGYQASKSTFAVLLTSLEESKVPRYDLDMIQGFQAIPVNLRQVGT